MVLIDVLQDDVTGVDPSVFRRYFREEEEEPEEKEQEAAEEQATAGTYNRWAGGGQLPFPGRM